MKYLIIDDEHELYDVMMADLFRQDQFDVTEIPRMVMPKLLRKLYELHYDHRINRRINLPFKMIWKSFYRLHKYPFDPSEEYCVLLMNGSVRKHFERKYLQQVKQAHPNVKLVLLLFDNSAYPGAKRAIELLDLFDYKFSFDKEDCQKFGMEHFYSCFSVPADIKEDPAKKSRAFFIGYGLGRLELLQALFRRIGTAVENCRFYIAGVEQKDREPIAQVHYDRTMSFYEEMQMQYNTDCIIEVVRQNQKGITLRTCEAVAFNKKLLTNNTELENMPFYDPRFMKIFKEPDEVDPAFLTEDTQVAYADSACFSPLRILERLEQLGK